jgi:hypothetical protein
MNDAGNSNSDDSVESLRLVKLLFEEAGELNERQFVLRLQGVILHGQSDAAFRKLFMAIDVDSSGKVRHELQPLMSTHGMMECRAVCMWGRMV